MKIDLHCHTKATKKGDSINRNVSAEDFKRIINSVNVKIVGITNHNVFDKEQYAEFIKVVDNDFMIWPGIELDVKGVENEEGHVVVVSNPKKVKEFEEKTNDLLDECDPNAFVCSIDKMIDYINSIDCIVMPHFYKPKSLKESSILQIKSKMNDNYRLLYEPSNFRSLGILINHSRNSIVGSDVKDWNKYHENDFSNLKIDVDSYEQFMLLIKKDVSLIETLLQKQFRRKIDISYLKKQQEEVEIYDDINIIFGSKGTGKSESLKKINSFFKEKGKNIGYYCPKDTQDKIDEKLNVLSPERKLSNYNKDNCKSEFDCLVNWNDEKVTQYKDYTNYISSKNKSANKERMKILEISTISNEYIEKTTLEETNLKYVNNIIDNLNKITLKNYLLENEEKKLVEIINKLYEDVFNKKTDAWENKESIVLSNFSVDKLKEIVEKKTELKTKPSSTGFLEFAKKRLQLKSNLIKIINGFNYEFDDNEVMVGNLEEGKELHKKTIIRMLCKDSKTDEFELGIKKLNEVKDLLDDIFNNIYKIDLINDINELKEILDDNKIKSLDDFLGVKKIFTVDSNEYRPSTGEATMIVLDEILKGNYDVYLLDEPEKSLGNAYVNDVLVPRINDLSKQKKCVVIVTHNANIAVRTLPFVSIYKEYVNGEYKTYIGNPYTNKLVNINNCEENKNWKDTSIRILEGGKEAFNERSEIYSD